MLFGIREEDFAMNFRDLEYIIAVAECKSFHKAADMCFVSQPALSMQVKKLENELQILLFERHKKQVLITPTGEKIIAKAKEILFLKEDFHSIVNVSKDPFTAHIKMGVFPTLAQYFIPQFLPQIYKTHPDLKIIPIEEKSEIISDQLETGKIDVALLALPIHSTSLVTKKIFEDKFLVAVHKKHHFSQHKEISLKEIQTESMLILEQGHCLRDQVISLTKGVSFNYTATSLETLRQMVQANLGITIIPKIASLKTFCASNEVVYINLEKPIPFRSIALVYRKSSPFIDVYNSLERILKSSYEGLIK